jgi:hypothetical protein
MSTILVIKEAITALKDRTGSSVPAITKWIESEKKVSESEMSLMRYSMICCGGVAKKLTFLFRNQLSMTQNNASCHLVLRSRSYHPPRPITNTIGDMMLNSFVA